MWMKNLAQLHITIPQVRIEPTTGYFLISIPMSLNLLYRQSGHAMTKELFSEKWHVLNIKNMFWWRNKYAMYSSSGLPLLPYIFAVTFRMQGNFSCFCCRLLPFFKINFFKKFYHYQSVKWFRSRSGPTFSRS